MDITTTLRSTDGQRVAPGTGPVFRDPAASRSQVVSDAYDWVLETYGSPAAAAAGPHGARAGA
ncbi:hypothetical protein [Streptomyces sp. NPDC089919]|uniref:hypothetical protein n=1 Tax=Streptomyces sp. NPDC089919 TaxID=3155188 RepID=UPI0034355255